MLSKKISIVSSCRRLVKFLDTDIWRIRSKELPPHKSIPLSVLRILVLCARGFQEDRINLRASALTFYTLLSVVPVFAMIFGIAKGFGFERTLSKFILTKFQGQEQVAGRIIEFSRAMLENVKGGMIAGIGIIFLFYTVIKIFSHIENAFNDIWGVKNARSFPRKVSDYLSAMLICPILFIISSAGHLLITSGVKHILHKLPFLHTMSPIILSGVGFLSYCILWILFIFIYMFMPNTKVHLSSAIIAGVSAGSIYQLFQWAYIQFQIHMTKYNAIYGSFAALPLFFIWLQLSWTIVLIGAEISFAYQNVHTYEFEKDSMKVSPGFKRVLSLRVLNLIIKGFVSDRPPFTAYQISHETDLPIRLVNQILFELQSAGLISEVKKDDEMEPGYQPAISPEKLTIQSAINALEENGERTIPIKRTKELDEIEGSLHDFSLMIENSSSNRLLKEI